MSSASPLRALVLFLVPLGTGHQLTGFCAWRRSLFSLLYLVNSHISAWHHVSTALLDLCDRGNVSHTHLGCNTPVCACLIYIVSSFPVSHRVPFPKPEHGAWHGGYLWNDSCAFPNLCAFATLGQSLPQRSSVAQLTNRMAGQGPCL